MGRLDELDLSLDLTSKQEFKRLALAQERIAQLRLTLGGQLPVGGEARIGPPLLVLFLNVGGPLRLGVLALLGIAMLSTAPVLMAVVLENAGDNPAAANGTYFMISFAARAVVLLAVGALADAVGLRAAFLCCAAFGVLGIPFVLMLPRPEN